MSKARSTDALLNDPIDPVGAVVGGDGETDAAEWSLVQRVRKVLILAYAELRPSSTIPKSRWANGRRMITLQSWGDCGMLTPAFHRKVIQKSFTTSAAAVIAGWMISSVSWSACAQQSAIKRTDLATADQSATDAGAMWVAEIAPGASTGRHTHPTPRFVYVLEGAVVLEMDGKPPRTFTVGEGFVEPPGEVHNFRNASTTAPAKAIGFQIAPKGMPLQTTVP